MKTKRSAFAGALLATLAIVGSAAFADHPAIRYQPEQDSPIGERNSNAPQEVAKFEFLIGDWDVEITWHQPQGEPTSYQAKWHNHWINDGFDVMQEWRGPYITGTEFRHYDPALGHWVGKNLYVGGNWVDTTAKVEGDNMVVTIEASNARDGAFLNRETYYEISENRWRMKSDRSFDGGGSWQKGRYEMIATRSGASGN
jgi:hypothetical protein